MNVIISNQQDNIINSLKVEVIKSVQGEFEVDDIINNFCNFFFNRMVIDVTALKDYTNILTYQKLSIGLPVDKIILLIPSDTIVASNTFLSQLISMGYYNFTTNGEGVEYLMQHPNSYKDVAHIHQIIPDPVVQTQVSGDDNSTNSNSTSTNRIVIGVKNITDGAGATTLTYMLYKELINRGIPSLAIEVNKRDFSYFNDESMISTTNSDFANVLVRNQNYSVIFVDLNDADASLCDDVIYLVEPSIIKMNRLMKKDRMVFNRLSGKKFVLNKCVLTKSDIREFEREIGSKLFFVLQPIDDRQRQDGIIQLLSLFGIVKRK